MSEQSLIIEKSMGCLLGKTVGDILGAAVEGMSHIEIVARYGEVRDFLETPRGFGCYTDDTEMALALTQSLVDMGGIDGSHCSALYADYFSPQRGYGGGAVKVLKALKKGLHYTKTGDMVFFGGSYANGGAMRIAPLGIFYHRETDPKQFKEAVFEAVRCTHVHPEGVDGAVVIAKAAALLTPVSQPLEWDPQSFLEELLEFCGTDVMKQKLALLQRILRDKIDAESAVSRMGCGIRASEAVSCALLALMRHYREPEEGVIKSVNYGGDTDTIGAMAGALLGTLHGKDWIPDRWFNNIENGKLGRDHIMELAAQMGRLAELEGA